MPNELLKITKVDGTSCEAEVRCGSEEEIELLAGAIACVLGHDDRLRLALSRQIAHMPKTDKTAGIPVPLFRNSGRKKPVN